MKGVGVFHWIFLVGFVCLRGKSDPVEDKQALLDFVTKLPHSRPLNWNATSPVCGHWTGVTCSGDKSRVVAVRLPGVGFDGPIPPNTLSRLTSLQILSLRSNRINGHFPSDFTTLRNLSFLYLQFNDFSGPLPWNFSAWKNLTIVNLSNNHFNGSLPLSLSNLTNLAGLNLASNSLSGQIPDLQLPNLHQLNLSDNDFNGSVPESLRRFPESVFRGNNISFQAFAPEFPPVVSPSSPPYFKPGSISGGGGGGSAKSGNGKLGETALLGIVVAGAVLGLVAFAFLMLVCFSRKKRNDGLGMGLSGKLHKGDMSPEKVISRSQDANNRLVFFEGCNYAFDLEDLLRASAEVLGKGTFGTAYRAILEDSVAVVVKRLKDVNVGKREFEQQMELVGSIRHENVVELKAYYYSKEEKLMLYDYYSQGSVSAILHGMFVTLHHFRLVFLLDKCQHKRLMLGNSIEHELIMYALTYTFLYLYLCLLNLDYLLWIYFHFVVLTM